MRNMTKPLVIGVAGGSGAGKTTIIQFILKEVGADNVVLLQHDSYYKDSDLDFDERKKMNYDHPDSLETSLLVKHVNELIEGKDITAPKYDYKNHKRMVEGDLKKPRDIIIIDGILLYVEKSLRDLMDVKIFVDTESDLRFIRRLQRDISDRGRTMDSVIEQYTSTVRPMHRHFVEPSRRYADVIIPEGHNKVSTKMLVSVIRDRMSGGKSNV